MRDAWPLALFLVGNLSGMLLTRYIMAPRFCPRCLVHEQWVKSLKDDKKAESRRWFGIRRARKDKDDDLAPR